jgi:hypothetical protein
MVNIKKEIVCTRENVLGKERMYDVLKKRFPNDYEAIYEIASQSYRLGYNKCEEEIKTFEFLLKPKREK